MRHFVRRTIAFVIAVIILTAQGFSQTTSGTISGFVEDQTKAAVSNAGVTLTNEQTSVVVTTKTQKDGSFTFPGVQPGTFTVVIDSPGFKELRKVHLTLNALQNLSTGNLMLQVGSSAENVTVTADITPIQSDSSDRSDVLDNKQTENLLAVGRDVMSMLRVMPGTVPTSEATSLSTSEAPVINGIRSDYNLITVDGVVSNTRGDDNFDTPLNLDAVKEVSVLQSNYKAEYGATAGSNISYITKNGTRDFHGSLYYYNRNEAFNANSYFNKLNGQSRPQYRYNTSGGTLGGPIFWPSRFNQDRNKLFFFVAIEDDPNRTPEGLQYYTVPTDLEKKGNFSQSYNQGTTTHNASTLIRIKDPSSSKACAVNAATPGAGCFSNNTIPNVSSAQQALLNIFPEPNFSNLAVSSGNYNYVTNYTADTSVNQEVFRVDYAPTEKLHAFVRGELMTVNDNGYNTSYNPAIWGIRMNYQVKSPNLAVDTTYAFNPNTLNELTIGLARRLPEQIYNPADLAKIQLSPSTYNINTLYAGNNPLNLFPKISFGGIKNAAAIQGGTRFPVRDHIYSYSEADNFTKIINAHTLKFGVNLQQEEFFQGEKDGVGTFAWAKDTSNPNDSNYAYSNALLGNFDNYTEQTHMPNYLPMTYEVEWYGQDDWKVNRQLTLNYGMRFTYDIPQHSQSGSNFEPSLYDPAKTPVLYRPTSAKSLSVDPTTNKTYPAAYAGLFVPNTGDTANGMLSVNTPGYPQGGIYGSGLLYAPRIGFSLDPIGTGKTVIRGGYGMFYHTRPAAGMEGGIWSNPPGDYKVTQYYGNVATFQSTAGLLGPATISDTTDLHPKVPYSMDATLGVQRTLGAGVLLDVAYVGTFARHLSDLFNINEVPYGAEFELQNQSPAGGVLPDNFFRPYPGYAVINQFQYRLTSNYNSLQVRATRRFSKSLGFGVSYTYSKALDFGDDTNDTLPTYQDLRTWSYGPAEFDRRHILIANYIWNLPSASRAWSNIATRAIFDHWQISGIASHTSGAPNGITFTTSNGANITGGGDGARVVLTGDPNRHAPHTFHQWFDTSVVQVPIAGQAATSTTPAVPGQTGNAGKVSFYNPGVTNFDTALFKNIPIHEKLLAQFRLETYNTFNHSEFNGVNAAATFANANASTTPQTSATFGQLSSTAHARYLQLALRIQF